MTDVIIASILRYFQEILINCHGLMHTSIDMMDWIDRAGSPENLPPKEQVSCNKIHKQAKVKN